MHVAARWSIVPLLVATGAITLLATLPPAEPLEDVFPDQDVPDVVVYEYPPITGPQLRADHASCLPFLAGLTARPDWTLQAVYSISGCMGTQRLDRFEIHAGGLVVWQPVGLAERRIQLAPAQLERVRKLDALSCTIAADVGEGDIYYDVGLGIFDGTAVAGGGAHLSEYSPAGAELKAVLDEAIDAYAQGRIAELGAIDFQLAVVPWGEAWSPTTAVYRLTLGTDRVLRTRRGDKLLHANTVKPRELIDAVDWAIARSTEGVVSERRGMSAVGTLTVGARTYPAGLRRWESYEWSPQGILFHAANAAQVREKAP